MLLVNTSSLFYLCQKGTRSLEPNVFGCNTRFRNSLCTVYSRCSWLSEECQGISRWSTRVTWLPGFIKKSRGQKNHLLSAFVTFVHIWIKINIGDISVQYWSWCFNHAIWELGVYSNSVATCVLAKETIPSEKDSRDPTYSFYLSGVHKIKGLNLFHDRTEELDFSTTSRRGTSPFYLWVHGVSASFTICIAVITLSSNPSEMPNNCKWGRVTVRKISA